MSSPTLKYHPILVINIISRINSEKKIPFQMTSETDSNDLTVLGQFRRKLGSPRATVVTMFAYKLFKCIENTLPPPPTKKYKFHSIAFNYKLKKSVAE